MPNNKPFKKKKAAKDTGGRKVGATVKSRKIQTTASRNQAAAAVRDNKRDEALLAKRSSTLDDPPKIVAFVPLTDMVDTVALRDALYQIAHPGMANPPAHTPATITLDAFKMKHRFTLFCPARETLAVLDIVKVADIVVWCGSAGAECDPISEFGEHVVKLVKAQGVPCNLGSLQMRQDRPKAATVVAARKDYEKWLHFQFADKPRVVPLSAQADVMQMARFLLSARLKAVPWRDMYPYTLAHQVTAEKFPDDQPGCCSLRISGYASGAHAFNVNSPVHITGVGSFLLRGIEAVPPASGRRGNSGMDAEQQVVRVLPTEKQDTLVSENAVDDLAQEQTWPTEEELAEADSRAKKMVPKGTSSYQAAWYLDQDDEEEEEDDDEEDGAASEDGGMMDASEEEDEAQYSEEELEELQDDEDNGDEMDDEQREAELKRWREAKDDGEFPDEKDTPGHMPARTYFQKYRALSSFRKAGWDPKESLPMDYSRIYQLHNLKRTKKLALAAHAEMAAAQEIELGSYVTLVVGSVPEAFAASCATRTMPLLCVGLHPHENKMSLVNMKLRRTEEGCNEPIKSKAELEFHVGFMRFVASALFSTECRGSVNNKHKLERFWHPDSGYVTASVYAPIKYPPAPVLCFTKPEPALAGHPPASYVASGQVESVDADRIVLKRLTLSGLPFRVHKRYATVRFMFFNPEDIRWFKKAPLWTKHGRMGNIRESLGTHGYMKCVFNQPIQQHDTVCMSLYKRVFPKWRSNVMNAQF